MIANLAKHQVYFKLPDCLSLTVGLLLIKVVVTVNLYFCHIEKIIGETRQKMYFACEESSGSLFPGLRTKLLKRANYLFNVELLPT